MHGHIEHLLELDRIFSDGDTARLGKITFLNNLALPADHTECQETFVFEVLNSFDKLLSLLVTELLLGEFDSVVCVDLRVMVTIG